MAMKMRYPTATECKKKMSELSAQREQLYRQQREIQNELKDLEREYKTCRQIEMYHKKEDDHDGE